MNKPRQWKILIGLFSSLLLLTFAVMNPNPIVFPIVASINLFIGILILSVINKKWKIGVSPCILIVFMGGNLMCLFVGLAHLLNNILPTVVLLIVYTTTLVSLDRYVVPRIGQK